MLRAITIWVALTFWATTAALGGWYLENTAFSNGGTAANRTAIPNELFEFKAGDLKCGATPVSFRRNSDDSVSEWRELFCWTGKDTRVSTLVNCNLPLWSMQGITIRKGGKTHMPSLVCGPNEKKE